MALLDTEAFIAFAAHLQIPTRDYGPIPFTLWGTQRYALEEISRGLADGVHEFVILKGGRQIGGTTLFDALDLWWHQANEGTQGILVADSDENKAHRRDIIVQMLESLPRAYKLPVRVNNLGQLAWARGGSRLMFDAAGQRASKGFGRGRGINYLHADEVGAWVYQRGIAALRNALSKKHPARLYTWNSTAQGIGSPFHEMCKTAEKAVAQRFIFVAWWRHEGYQLPDPPTTEAERRLWERYGDPHLTEEETITRRAVKKRYGVDLTLAQIAWYRWQLAEEFQGDEVMLAQEYGSLPEDCFQAFGDKFIPPHEIRHMRLGLETAPEPTGYRYAWARTLDESQVHVEDPDDAELLIWEEPAKDGVYVVAGHPQFSSSEVASEYVVQVFRAWPDQLVQVAEFASDEMSMYQHAWACLHLAGAYRTFVPAFFILEVAGPGRRVLEEMNLLQQHGYGLAAHPDRLKLQNFLGSVTHYFYTRPDMVSGSSSTISWVTSQNNRGWMLHGLRDALLRGHLTVRSTPLIDELASVRRGEEGDADQIAGASQTSDARVMCAALAVECWLHSAMPQVGRLVAPKDVPHDAPTTVEHRIVQNYLGNLKHSGRA